MLRKYNNAPKPLKLLTVLLILCPLPVGENIIRKIIIY